MMRGERKRESEEMQNRNEKRWEDVGKELGGWKKGKESEEAGRNEIRVRWRRV